MSAGSCLPTRRGNLGGSPGLAGIQPRGRVHHALRCTSGLDRKKLRPHASELSCNTNRSAKGAPTLTTQKAHQQSSHTCAQPLGLESFLSMHAKYNESSGCTPPARPATTSPLYQEARQRMRMNNSPDGSLSTSRRLPPMSVCTAF